MQIDFDPNIDYYKALGVAPSATLDEIKKAYRKLAKQNHPDSTGGDKAKEARFKEIGAAYDVLGDAKKRKQYDEIRAMGGMRARGGGPGGMSGFPGGMGGMSGFPGGGRGGAGQGQAWDLGDLFAQMFAQQGGAPAGGGRRSVRFERGDDDDGWVFEHRQGGRPPTQPGPSEAFEGKTQASDGSWLMVKGKDVHSDVHIPFGDAILGTVAEVATLDGKASVKIPPGTGSGKKLRLRGKGVLTGEGGTGDHYVTVQIDVPASLDDKAKKLLVELTTHLQSSSGGARRK